MWLMPTARSVWLELDPGPRRLNTDVAVRIDKAGHVIDGLVFDLQSRETPVPEPSEHRVIESDRIVVVQHSEFDVMNTAPSHHAPLNPLLHTVVSKVSN